MDNETAQIRNFKDFLQLYNKITELCFGSCVDNFYNRNISDREGTCVDNCVKKFSYVNQKLLGVYVDVQSGINTKRLAEVEAQAAEAALRQQQQSQLVNESTAISDGSNSVASASDDL